LRRQSATKGKPSSGSSNDDDADDTMASSALAPFTQKGVKAWFQDIGQP
jgi:hypothetical protein